VTVRLRAVISKEKPIPSISNSRSDIGAGTISCLLTRPNWHGPPVIQNVRRSIPWKTTFHSTFRVSCTRTTLGLITSPNSDKKLCDSCGNKETFSCFYYRWRNGLRPYSLETTVKKTQLLYVSSYLAVTARWRETGVGPGGCIVSALNCIQ